MALPEHKTAIFVFPECRETGKIMAKGLNCPLEDVAVHTFPDGETLVKLPAKAKNAILYRSLHHPNPKLFEVVQAAATLRDMGAEKVTLVSPYLPYMRQDKVFHEGEALSQKIFGKMMTPFLDGLVTVEAHLHRTRNLSDVFPGVDCLALSAASPMAEFLKEENLGKRSIILGPDEESRSLVEPVADALGLQWGVAVKKRFGDKNVKLALPENLKFRDRNVVIADDVISSGMTVARAAEAVLQEGAKSVRVAVAHALYDRAGADVICKAGVEEVFSSDSVPHPTNRIRLAPFLARRMK